MNADQNDRLLDETIRRAVGSETARFDAAGWMKKHREEVALLRSRRTHKKGKLSPTLNWRTTMTILKYVGGLSVAASVAVVIFLTLHSTTPEVSAAEALKQAATATSSYEGWIHMDQSGEKPARTATFDLNTRDDTVAIVTNIDNVREVTFLSPAKHEYLRYSSKTKTIEKNINDAEGTRAIAETAKKQLLSPESLQQALDKYMKAEVTQGKEGDLDRFEIIPKGKASFEKLTVLADPTTKLIQRMDVQLPDGDKLVMKLTYSGSSTITSIYDLGVPRDAKIVASQPATAVSGQGPVADLTHVLALLRRNSYEFAMDVRMGNESNTVKGAVLEPGKLRLEQTGGLGPIVSIIDNDTKHSLLLWERFKAAYQFDKQEQEKEELGGLGFLILPGRLVSNLWNLRASKEAKLDQKQVDGHTAQGFRVTQKSDDYTETITVWADAKTAAPLKVEIALQSNNDEKQVLELTLRDFNVVQKPDPALFRTDVPVGYTLANRQTLKQLATAPATDVSVAKTSPGAEQVLAAIRLWHEGKKQKAIETLMTVDWEGDLRFSREHYLFTMTESQYISLVTGDQQKVMAEIMSQSTDCRAIARELVDLARKAHAAKNDTEAEKYLHAAVGLGQLLDRDKNMMLIVRMVGIAIQRFAAGELETMYEAQGQADKLQHIQKRIRDLEEQTAEIKRTASGQ